MHYHELKRLFSEAFPETGSKLFGCAYFLADRFDYGVWRADVAAVRHANLKVLYNERGFYRKLPKSDIYCHFLSRGSKEDMLWYVNSCRIQSERRLLMPMLDFDNKNELLTDAEMDEVVRFVQELHPSLKAMYIQRSTSGTGRHAYPLLASSPPLLLSRSQR